MDDITKMEVTGYGKGKKCLYFILYTKKECPAIQRKWKECVEKKLIYVWKYYYDRSGRAGREFDSLTRG